MKSLHIEANLISIASLDLAQRIQFLQDMSRWLQYIKNMANKRYNIYTKLYKQTKFEEERK